MSMIARVTNKAGQVIKLMVDGSSWVVTINGRGKSYRTREAAIKVYVAAAIS